MTSFVNRYIIFLLLSVFFQSYAIAQQKVLGLKEAEQLGLSNYSSIKAKANQLNASKALVNETRAEKLPDLSISAQQVYGTVNSQFGPSYGYRGLSVASSGPILGNQNWNAAFGSLYLSNISWDFFSFGRAMERVKVQKNTVALNESDLVQEQFQHEI